MRGSSAVLPPEVKAYDSVYEFSDIFCMICIDNCFIKIFSIITQNLRREINDIPTSSYIVALIIFIVAMQMMGMNSTSSSCPMNRQKWVFCLLSRGRE